MLNTLGVALYRNGQFPAALPVLEQSLRLGRGPGTAVDLFFLAMCHAKLGDASKARGAYDRAMGLAVLSVGAWTPEADELREFRLEAATVLHAAGIATDPAPAPRER